VKLITKFDYSIELAKLSTIEFDELELTFTPPAYAALFNIGKALELNVSLDLVLKTNKEMILKESKKVGFGYINTTLGWKFHNIILTEPYLYYYEKEEDKTYNGYFYLENASIKKSRSNGFYELLVRVVVSIDG
jgi:hypothetical protein